MKNTYSENIIGRYIKHLKTGNISQLISIHPDTGCYKSTDLSLGNMDINYRIRTNNIELMPIGFNPNKKHYEIYY